MYFFISTKTFSYSTIILDTYSDNIFAKGQLRTELNNDYNEYNEIIKNSKEIPVKLSDRTKANLEYFIGISLEEFNNLSAEEQDRFVEKQIGKKPTYSKNSYVDGYSIKTMDEVDKGINKIIKTGYVKRFIRKIKNSKQNK